MYCINIFLNLHCHFSSINSFLLIVVYSSVAWKIHVLRYLLRFELMAIFEGRQESPLGGYHDETQMFVKLVFPQ